MLATYIYDDVMWRVEKVKFRELRSSSQKEENDVSQPNIQVMITFYGIFSFSPQNVHMHDVYFFSLDIRVGIIASQCG